MVQAGQTFQPISALPHLSRLLGGTRDNAKADISLIKKLLADTPTTPPPVLAFTLQDARDALELLRFHSRQLGHWKKEPIAEAERAEVVRLQAVIPELRPLLQRLIALLIEVDNRAAGSASPRKKWRH